MLARAHHAAGLLSESAGGSVTAGRSGAGTVTRPVPPQRVIGPPFRHGGSAHADLMRLLWTVRSPALFAAREPPSCIGLMREISGGPEKCCGQSPDS